VKVRSVAVLTALCAVATVMGQVQGPASRPRPDAAASAGRPLRVLFLGQDQERPHSPATMFPLLAAPLARRGIQLTYVATVDEALVPDTLRHYDGLMLYANHKTLTPEQERTLLGFVEAGKGLVAIHCASDMFTASERYLAMIGGQFQRHGAGEFTAAIVQPEHPIVAGLEPFATWDETYVHTRHNPANRTVLMERVDGEVREPWTWVRTQGRGRVFYTAYGHDRRTWSQPGFHTLIERAVVWTVDEAARTAHRALKMPEVKYVEGFNVPNYEKRDPAPNYQLPFTPEESMKFIQVPAEFELQLFASEPEIRKPITFSFDERGRLWVIEALDYPNKVLHGAPGDDRIKIVEDTNGDGRADKFTVFAEHLNFLFLKDTNGDDKADVREVLSTGWGVQDSHAGPSNLQYGPDNFIWGVVGYSGFKGQMNGKPMQFGQGVYRFKPDGTAFEVITGSTNNTWGLGFSETFDVFGSTANNDPSFYVAIPNRYFEGVEGLPAARGSGPGYQSVAQFYAAHHLTPYIRQVDVHGGYTAAAGHYLYTARAFPRKYWNRVAFITEPTAHLVGQAVLEPQGAGFVARDGWNLMAGAEEWVAPVHAQVGPDGAVWVSDWYNFIAQHNPTPPGHSNGPGNAYETSMRDRARGRIYRVVSRNAPAPRPPTLSRNDPASLVAALSSDNMFWRLHAQRLIVERGQKDVVASLVALVRNTSVDAVGTNGGALHALWALHGLEALGDTSSEAYRAAAEALKHPAAGVRKAAAMVLPRTQDASRAILAASLLRDPDLHTRLAAILTLSEMPPDGDVGRSLYAASQQSENYGDRWLSRALYIAASRHRDHFLTQYKADPKALPSSALPIALRLGATKPDWRTPDGSSLAADWKDMEVPGNWEARGLPDFDGVVWFTRTFDVPQAPTATLSLGRIAHAADVWINGESVQLAPAPTASAGSTRGAVPPTYAISAGTLRAGTNVLTVRVQNFRSDGGFLGTPESMYVQAGEDGTQIPLAGTWKYRVERQTNAAALYSKPGELAAHLAFTASGGATAEAAGREPSDGVVPVPDLVVRLGVIPIQMKFDRTELTVGAGQLVEIVFVNPDVMQHNFVLGAPGSLETIGLASDELAKSPDGLARQYVPELPQVLFATKLVEPGQTVRVQFRAPSEPGQYPYVCTFPAHWRFMSGVMNVVPPRAR
jgi:putative membrane-bound dehydrogenase-like protein